MLNFEIIFWFWKIRIWKLFSIYGKYEFEFFYFLINYLITVGKIYNLPNYPILLDTCKRQTFNKINVGSRMEQPH